MLERAKIYLLTLHIVNTKADSTASLRSGKDILVADRGANTHSLTVLLVLKLMLAIAGGLQGLTHDCSP